MESSTVDWKFVLSEKTSIEVGLKYFEKTDLERELDSIFGYKPRNVYENIVKTYKEALLKYCTEDIKIKTDKVPPQIYKWCSYEIEIIPE